MVFEDRISAYPGRYSMTDENGNVSYVVLERADEPTVPGTPLNADTFNGMQEEYQVESEEYPGCFYRVLNGVECWINPPMVVNTEYRTDKRLNGKPVYIWYTESNFVFSDGPNTIAKNIAPIGAEIVEIHGMLVNKTTGDRQVLPFFADDGTLNAMFNITTSWGDGTRIAALTKAMKNCGGYSVCCLVKYTKADDVV